MDARLSNNTVEQRADVASAVESRLVAAKRLPAQIAIRAAEINQRLTEQQRPKTELQRILWQQVAHRASGIESWDACEESILRVGGCNAVRINAATVVPGSGSNDQPQETSADDYLVASISSEHIEKLNRNRRQQQHGLFRALAFIDTLTTKNEKEPFAKLELPDIRRHFPDRMTCEQYLISSQVVDQWRCPHCGDGPKRCWLKGRRRWECGHCGSQHGLRQGTIMEHSPLPIEKWFWSILLVCSSLDLSAASLADAVEIARIATARRMLSAILLALQSPDRDRLLMGLPRFLTRLTLLPELGGDLDRILRNQVGLGGGINDSATSINSDVMSQSCDQ